MFSGIHQRDAKETEFFTSRFPLSDAFYNFFLPFFGKVLDRVSHYYDLQIKLDISTAISLFVNADLNIY